MLQGLLRAVVKAMACRAAATKACRAGDGEGVRQVGLAQLHADHPAAAAALLERLVGRAAAFFAGDASDAPPGAPVVAVVVDEAAAVVGGAKNDDDDDVSDGRGYASIAAFASAAVTPNDRDFMWPRRRR